MNRLLLPALIATVLAGCSDPQSSPSTPPAAPTGTAPLAAADVAAGKALAERDCRGCHGLDGRSMAPAIPNLAAQSERYLLTALSEYRQGKRLHAALKEMTDRMTDADARNLAAYYAGLPAPAPAGTGAERFLPYESGRKLAVACAECHGEDGNSTKPGTPSLAGQQPRYLVIAIQEYLHAERGESPMHPMLRRMERLEQESLALYFSSQRPAQRAAPPFGDPAAGEPLTAVCGGCHGLGGVSADSATPNLAGQDARYLVDAINAYRSTRKRESMRAYVTALGDKDIENMAAYYSIQRGKPAAKGETLIQELTAKCDRCHAGPENPAMVVPKIHGQDKDYLIMALRAYRDDRRESSAMHRMSLPYGDSVIESLAGYYASQPLE